MAAPSSTKWSSVYGSSDHEARLGIYYSTSGTDTSVKVYVEIWFWSEYTCYDKYNTLYFSIGEGVSSASVDRGNVSINCTSSSQWSTSNQKCIYSNTFTFDRHSSSRTINMYAKLDTVEYIYSSPMYNNTSVTLSPITTYTVKYDANGGSGAPSSQTKTHGKALTLSSTKPTRTGHNFLYWKVTRPNGDVYYYSAGGKTEYDGNQTLYAVWEKKTYTVKYDANGGSGAPSSQTKTYGEALTISSKKPTRTGYNFLYWKVTRPSGDVYYYSAGSTTEYDGNQTLYAVWEKKTYTVKYDANGGSGAPSSQTKTYGVALTISSTKPTRTGYNFLYWKVTRSDGSVYYYSAGSTTEYDGNQTLYAVWEKKTYTVKYDANGGSGAPSSQTKTHGETLTLRSTKPTRAGYNFLYWKVTRSNGDVYYYSAGSTTEYDGNQTLYAVWGDKTYVVSYDANGGSGAPSSQTKIHGEALTLSSKTPTRTGFTFDCWKVTRSNGDVYYYSVGSKTEYDGNQTLYAQWIRNTYTISYNANGGSGVPSSQTKSHGLSMTISSTKPKRTGYTFLGWHTSSSATEALYYAGGKLPSTFNVSDTLYAVWELGEKVDVEILTTSVSVSGNHGVVDADDFGTLSWKTVSGASGMNYYISAHCLDNIGAERFTVMSKKGAYVVNNNTTQSVPFYYLGSTTKLTGDLNNIKLGVYVYTESTNGEKVHFVVDIASQYTKPKILKAIPKIKDGKVEYSILIETNCYQPSDILTDIRTPTIKDDLGKTYTSTAVRKVSDKIVEFKTTPVALSSIGTASKLTITISDGLFQDKMMISIPKIENTIDYNSINQKLSSPLLIEDDSISSFEFSKGGIIRFKEYIESDEILDNGFSMGNNGIIAGNICEK